MEMFPAIILLFQSSGDGSTVSIIGATIIAMIIAVIANVQLEKRKREELIKAGNVYRNLLKQLKSNPTSAYLRQSTLAAGRRYSLLTKQLHSRDKAVRIYNEIELNNDIRIVAKPHRN